jgi:anti-sigma regulatory factor (Ser/Thr protein kinase)
MRVELDSTPSAAAEARAALGTLDGTVDRAVLDDARLLVSELVTNSVRHAGVADRVGLEVVARPDGMRVEVIDSGAGFEPRARDDDMDRIGGWGLHLVERIAARWGVEGRRPTRVWFELAA